MASSLEARGSGHSLSQVLVGKIEVLREARHPLRREQTNAIVGNLLAANVPAALLREETMG